jgi:hypothetical protein
MILFLLAYLGGVLTIVSPCILPVLPFVFARADRPFLHSGLPMLLGMAVTFAAVATLAAVAGGWAENFISPGGAVQDVRHVYAIATPRLNEWALSGDWTIGKEDAALNERGGSIVYRFHARDLHLVLGPGPDGKPVRFRVTVDGAPPGDSHGADVDADGQGIVTGQRLYQLIRQNGKIADHTFEIEFLDPGVQAYAFTFG